MLFLIPLLGFQTTKVPTTKCTPKLPPKPNPAGCAAFLSLLSHLFLHHGHDLGLLSCLHTSLFYVLDLHSLILSAYLLAGSVAVNMLLDLGLLLLCVFGEGIAPTAGRRSGGYAST